MNRSELKRVVLAIHGAWCGYCGAGLGPVWHLEHIIPISKGGDWHPDNLIPACPRCNLRKQNRDVPEFKAHILDKLRDSLSAALADHADVAPMLNPSYALELTEAIETAIELVQAAEITFHFER